MARDYMVLAKAYGSADEMIEDVGATVSFANAILAARNRYPDPTPEPKPGKKGRGIENEPVTIEPDGAESLPVVCQTPASDSDGPGMLDDIQRIAANLADDLVLMGKVHAILVKAEAKAAREAACTKGRGEPKAKAKFRKPAAKKKRGKAA